MTHAPHYPERGLFTHRASNLLVLVLFGLVTFLVNNHVFLTDIMESRNLIAAREMVEEGHWLVPTMNGELRLEKPPLPTWVAALLWMAAPDNVPLQRAAAGAAGLMLLLLFYALARRLTGSDRYAMIAALVLGTSYNLILMGRTASWDIWCHAWMLGALLFLVRAFEGPGRRLGDFLAAGLCAGLSFLSKGPVSFYALLLPFLLGYLFCFRPRMRGKWGGVVLALLVMLIAGGWWYAYIYAFHRTEALTVLARESAAWADHHVRPWYYYWGFAGETGVWALMLLSTLPFAYWMRRLAMRREYLFALLWTVGMVVLLSFLPEKKNRYLLPMLIPAALTVAFLLNYWADAFRGGRATRTDRWLYGLNAWAVVLAVAALPVLSYVFLYARGAISLGAYIGLTAFLVLVALYLLVAAALRRRPLALLAGVVVLFLGAEVGMLPYVAHLYHNPHYHSIRLTRTTEALDGIPFYYDKRAGLRIDLVYEAGRTIRPLDLADSAAVVQALPFALVSHRPAAETLPPSVLPAVGLKRIGRFDDNRQQPTDKHYTPMFLNEVTLVTRTANPLPCAH